MRGPCAFVPSPHIVVYATIHDKETHIQQLHIQQSVCCLDNESHICPIHKLAPFSESQKRELAVCVVLLAQLGVLVNHELGDLLAAFAQQGGPVSYTHLDVYKRQVLGSGIVAEHGP